MTSTIRETISDNLPAGIGGYRTEVEAVTRALETREAMLVTQLINAAVNAGLNPSDAQGALSDLGLHMPVEPVAQDEPEDTSVEGRVSSIERSVEKLADTIGSLVSLAEQRLGVRI